MASRKKKFRPNDVMMLLQGFYKVAEGLGLGFRRTLSLKAGTAVQVSFRV